MRKIDPEIKRRAELLTQVRSNNADPHAKVTIARPVLPLTQKTALFLERQPIIEVSTPITDLSIAVSHAVFGEEHAIIWIAYLQDGMVHIKYTENQERMSDYLLWSDYDITLEADSIDIAFQASVKRNIHGEEEYITEDYPWLFWTKDGVAYGKNLTTRENGAVTVTLATANCTDISAVRAASGTYGYDFGLVVFMLISGNLFYRQNIKGEWYDAELVSEGPEGSYVSIAAFRTWDYRVGVQIIDSEGVMHELFSQFEGIGTRNQEHIDVQLNVEQNMPRVTYINTREDEHLEVGSITAESAMYRAGPPDLVEAYNIPTTLIDPETEEEYEDWGIRAVYVFNRQLVKEQVEAQFQAFTLTDIYGITYYPLAAELGEDGHSVTLTFTDFNNAFETCTAKYTPGTVQTMADDYLVAVSKTFIPEHLNPSPFPQPEVERIWNE